MARTLLVAGRGVMHMGGQTGHSSHTDDLLTHPYDILNELYLMRTY